MTKPELECDRRGLKPGIVHFGVGGFHRAHQAVYIDDLLAQGKAKDWAILGVGVMPGDVRMRDALESQDQVYGGHQASGWHNHDPHSRLHRRLLVRPG